MYRAKVRGCRHAVFDSSMHERAMAALRIENELRRALERGELRVHYQPIVELSSSKILGVEALVRWEHREARSGAASEFIPLAEETGLVVPLGHWVLDEACRALSTLPEQITLSVNLSGRQLLQPEFCTELKEIAGPLPHRPLAPAAGAHREHADRQRGGRDRRPDAAPRYRGAALHRRFRHRLLLAQLPARAAHRLAQDRSLLRRRHGNDERKIKIVQSILVLGKALGIDVVAEGVETQEQVDVLRRLGCERAQGYSSRARSRSSSSA